MKIGLAMIVKGSDSEAPLLDRCLENVRPFVDEVFITITHKEGEKPNQAVFDVCVKHGVAVRYFQWVNDFSKARNYSFAQVPRGEFDYIMWADADDVFRGLEKLKPLIEANPTVDAVAMNYLYDFDDHNNPIVVHKKTMVVRNDGCVEWTGRLHEDFKENRGLNVQFTPDIERIHLTDDKRALESQIRNVEISKEEAEANPEDPRVYFNLANSYFGAGSLKLAKETYLEFIELTGSEAEKYIAYQRLSSVEQSLGNKEDAVKYLQLSIGMYPELPDSYNMLGYLYFEQNRYDDAEKYLLLGLTIKPQYHKMIVYNPRDYDYNPMMALAKVYYNKNRGDLALPLLKGCLKIYPNDEHLKTIVADMEKEAERLGKVVEVLARIDTYGEDKEKILAEIDALPTDLQSHPGVCRVRNQYRFKETSSGKDIAYYCGPTLHEWNPELAKTKGVGGSEEAVMNLAREWVKQGYNVTVYNSCGLQPIICDGVTYKPYWHYNAKDKWDITILWRHPSPASYELNTGKLFVDMHDVIPAGEFTPERLARIDKVFVKTNAHRILFPNIPDEKIAIIPNGQDMALFSHEIEKDPYLLVNTSSPDRSLDVLPKLFKQVKEQVPEARLKWAYGWEIFDNTFSSDKKMMEWKEKIVKDMEEAGIENLGRLPQAECAKLYQEGTILAYPSEFYEIDCITIKKAQACGCIPVTTDFAAFAESNKYGMKVHSDKTTENWVKPYKIGFGIEDEKTQKKWVAEVVKLLKKKKHDTAGMREWAKSFDWPIISGRWTEQF